MDREFNERLHEVENIINQGKKHLLSHMWLVDRDMLMDSLQELRGALPAAIQDANNINASRSRIMGDAKRFSDTMLAEAAARARTIQQEAEARVNQMLGDAEMRVAQMRQDSESQAHQIIDDAERQATALVAQTEIMRRAEVRAREVNEEALQHANGVYQEALSNAESILGRAEQLFGECNNELRRLRADLTQYR